MKIRKFGWAIWDKVEQRFYAPNMAIVFSDKTTAWLWAKKERKGTGLRVVKIKLEIVKK